MKIRPTLAACLCSVLTATVAYCADDVKSDRSPDAVLKRLKDGNARYMAGKSIYGRIDAARRQETAAMGQKPYSTVLGCSDSRVPPEVVLDQGFADVFVIRVAGNVCGDSELASAEYGAKYLGTQLLVVLGHSQCGAVDGALKGATLKGSLPKLIAMIQPAVDTTRKANPKLKGDALMDAAIESNVRLTMESLLRGSQVLRDLIKKRQLKIVGAVRDIKTGEIHWIGEHTKQAELLK